MSIHQTTKPLNNQTLLFSLFLFAYKGLFSYLCIQTIITLNLSAIVRRVLSLTVSLESSRRAECGEDKKLMKRFLGWKCWSGHNKDVYITFLFYSSNIEHLKIHRGSGAMVDVQGVWIHITETSLWRGGLYHVVT